MDYGELIGEALRIAWRNRYLWFFGLFISGGVGSLKISIPSNPESTEGFPAGFLVQWVRENVVLAVVLGVGLLLVLLLVFVTLSLISAGGLRTPSRRCTGARGAASPRPGGLVSGTSGACSSSTRCST